MRRSHSMVGATLMLTFGCQSHETAEPRPGSVEAIQAGLSLKVGPNVNITRLAGNHQEGAIAIDPTNPQRLFAFSNTETDAGNFAAFSTDGGLTWKSSQGPMDAGPGDFIIGDTHDGLVPAFGDPTVAFDKFGNLFAAYLSFTTESCLVPIIISTDGGAHFQQLTTVTEMDCDQPTLVTGPGSNGAPASLWLTYLNDTGVVVRGAPIAGAGPAQVGALGPAVTLAADGNFGDVAVGPAGQVSVTYQDHTDSEGPSNIFVASDPDGLGPLPFGAPALVTTTNVGGFDFIAPQPDRSIDAEAGLAYDLSDGPRRGRLYLVYTDEAPNESDDTNILIRSLDPGSTSWSAPVRVNDDKGTNSQFLPRMRVDPTSGDVGVSWHDARHDLGTGGAGDSDMIPNDDVQFFAAVSQNGATSFLPNVQVSAGTSQENGSEPPGPCCADLDYGDFTGLAFFNGVLSPIWADNSNSTGDNPGGKLGTMDMYTARITVAANTPPVAECKNASVFANAQCKGVVGKADIDNGSFDPDGDAFTCAVAPPSPYALGTTPVTLTCTDAGGTTGSCSAVVVVVDNTKPTLTAPPAKTITVCKHPSLGTPTASDNCAGLKVTNDAPAVFPLGTTVVTWKATDGSGNVTTATQSVTAVLGDDVSCCPAGTHVIVGTAGNDRITGTAGRDCILGRGGDDVIDGKDGDDFISGGAGNDTIAGGNGNDRIYGGAGNDTINASPGKDFIDGGSGTDTCFVDPANDTVVSCNP
jgi:hypothetical protein